MFEEEGNKETVILRNAVNMTIWRERPRNLTGLRILFCFWLYQISQFPTKYFLQIVPLLVIYTSYSQRFKTTNICYLSVSVF